MTIVNVLIVVAMIVSSYQHWRMYRLFGWQPLFMILCGVATAIGIVVVATGQLYATFVLAAAAFTHLAKAVYAMPLADRRAKPPVD